MQGPQVLPAPVLSRVAVFEAQPLGEVRDGRPKAPPAGKKGKEAAPHQVWHAPVFPAHRRLRQEDLEFELSLAT